jgi:predicted nucleotidyltransferase
LLKLLRGWLEGLVWSSALEALNLPNRIKAALKRFINELKKLDRGCEVYLFGSYARGDWLAKSDLDSLIISSTFEGLDLGKSYLKLRRLLPDWLSAELLYTTGVPQGEGEERDYKRRYGALG